MADIERHRNSIDYVNSGDIVADAKLIIDSAQAVVHQTINVTLIQRNWLLGMRISEEELGDNTRSDLYGRRVISLLADELTRAYGKGYTKRSLYQYVQFYRMFPEIVHSISAQSSALLTWTHYRELLRVKNDHARSWYEQEAANL